MQENPELLQCGNIIRMKHVPDKISVEEAFVEEGRSFEVGIPLKGKLAVSAVSLLVVRDFNAKMLGVITFTVWTHSIHLRS